MKFYLLQHSKASTNPMICMSLSMSRFTAIVEKKNDFEKSFRSKLLKLEGWYLVLALLNLQNVLSGLFRELKSHIQETTQP